MNDAAVWEEPCRAAPFSKSGCGERILHPLSQREERSQWKVQHVKVNFKGKAIGSL